jgi:hypothetical protein
MIPSSMSVSDTSHLHVFHYWHQLSVVFSLSPLYHQLVIVVSGGEVCNVCSMGEQAAYWNSHHSCSFFGWPEHSYRHTWNMSYFPPRITKGTGKGSMYSLSWNKKFVFILHPSMHYGTWQFISMFTRSYYRTLRYPDWFISLWIFK